MLSPVLWRAWSRSQFHPQIIRRRAHSTCLRLLVHAPVTAINGLQIPTRQESRNIAQHLALSKQSALAHRRSPSIWSDRPNVCFFDAIRAGYVPRRVERFGRGEVCGIRVVQIRRNQRHVAFAKFKYRRRPRSFIVLPKIDNVFFDLHVSLKRLEAPGRRVEA